MGKILLYAAIAATVFVTLSHVWVGAAAYYLVALFNPQAIWPWIFQGARLSLILSAITILGYGRLLCAKKIKYSYLKDKQNIYMLILWAALLNSYIFSPYGAARFMEGAASGTELIIMVSKIFLFYFVSIALFDDQKKMHYFVMVIIVCVVYYTYWANMRYLTGFYYQSRLEGPGPGGIYTDENKFAMVFIVGIPYLFFMGNYYKNRVVKLFLWACIPFAWHAIFLTGSLGGLLSLAASTLVMAIRTKKKIFIAAIPAVLFAAFIFQGGDYLKEKKNEGGGHLTQIGTAQQRLQAWAVGIKIALDHPITGAGIGNFYQAYPDYDPYTSPHVAHNTFFQFLGESGVVAGLMYLLICARIYWIHSGKKFYQATQDSRFFRATGDALATSIVGFFCCAMFVDFATYEIFYYLLVLSAVQFRLNLSPSSSLNENNLCIS